MKKLLRNSFYVNTGTNLAAKIPHGTTNFESYLPNITTIFQEDCLTCKYNTKSLQRIENPSNKHF